MEVQVRKNNVAKAITVLNRKVAEDGDLRRVIERQHYMSKGEKRRARLARAKARQRKEDQQRREEDF